MTAIAGIRAVVGKFFDRIHRSLVPSFPPGFFGSDPTFAVGTAGWTRLGARGRAVKMDRIRANVVGASANKIGWLPIRRSEEHTSELQSQSNLVCRLLLEKKKTDVQR